MNATDIEARMMHIGVSARAASRDIARASTTVKNAALVAIAAAVRRDAAVLVAANAEDVAAAKAAGLDDAMLDRLTLSDRAIETMAIGLEQIAALPDPIGEISELRHRPSGIQVGRMRVPLGVVGIIYEARPNVTDRRRRALPIKSGNAVHPARVELGSRPTATRALASTLISRNASSAATGLPADVVQLVAGGPTHASVQAR